MKEITRIHLAKVAYDIELDAKKDIQGYITALERYADDSELLSDIEIRITELLAERGVAAGGVITKADVAAVRAQLGEPSDFASEDATPNDVKDEDEPRRVYRDESDAILGGVMAGFAKFFGVDALLVRLIFIVLLFVSFGTALIIYIILWLIVPPARTAAEKLRMSGQAVTLASIKALGEKTEPIVNRSALVLRKTLRVGTALMLLTGAVAAFFAVVGVVGRVIFDREYLGYTEQAWLTTQWWLPVTLALFAAAGLLLSTLGFVLAHATFRAHWSKRIGIFVGTIIVVGILSFSSGLGMVWYGKGLAESRLNSLVETSRANLPDGFASVKSLKVESDTLGEFGNIEYIVSDKLHYEIESLPGAMRPRFAVSEDKQSATMSLQWDRDNMQRGIWGPIATPTLRIYGPALDEVEVGTNSRIIRYSNERPQSKLHVTVRDNANFELTGTYEAVNVVSASATSLERASIGELTIDNGGYVTAGVVRTLTVKQPDVCPADEMGNYVEVEAVSSGKMTHNDVEQPAKSMHGMCGTVIIGNSSEDGWEENV
jgi:phage shock protein PspC (stress-responsive transcriptional regulator)